MEITRSLAAATSPGNGIAAASGSGDAASPLTSDFETFLRMLTVQMQNQDPLNPAEASDFAVQLATFSSVEQQVLTNDLLAGMNGASGQGALGQSGALVGLEARSPAPVRFSGMPIGLHLPDRGDARSAELVVRDAAGKVLQRQALPQGVERVDWAGVDDSGAPFPEGLYRFEVELRTEAEMLGTEPAETYQRIAEIRFTKDGARELVFDGGGAASETEVSALRRPA